jgi:hypothetical protein
MACVFLNIFPLQLYCVEYDVIANRNLSNC